MRGHRSYLLVLACAGVLVSACGDDEITADAAPTRVASDVTFLVGLGSATDFSAKSTGGFGVLLPRERFDDVEVLTRVDEPDQLYDHLDVVAVRLDPCFFEGTGDVICSPQVRLVLQPVFDEDGSPTTRDATVHAFYAVPTEDVLALADRLARLRSDIGGPEVIGVHPAPDEAAALVLPHLGADRLIRVTFVAVHASNQAWTFGGFDVIDGAIQEIIPPGMSEHEQHLTSTGGTDLLDASILPEPAIEPDAARWLTAFERDQMDDATAASAVAGLERLLDPAAHNPGTVDCASCHMATTALHYAQLEQGGSSISDVYGNTQNQRMLGFFERTPAVSSRVEAETLGVLDALNNL